METSFGNDLFAVFQAPPNDFDGLADEYTTGAALVGGTGHFDHLGSSASTSGIWIHAGFTRVGSSGVQKIYIIKENFDPVTPSYLISTTGGTLTAAAATTLCGWIENTGAQGLNVSLAHAIVSDFVATEAQMLSQFSQRAPTTAFSTPTYTYLSCDDETAPEVDKGSTAANFTKTGTFAADATMPAEWLRTQPLNYPQRSAQRVLLTM